VSVSPWRKPKNEGKQSRGTKPPREHGCRRADVDGGEPLKALVWFWIIDETLVLTSMLNVCRLNEVGTCQVMEQVMIR